MSNIINRPTVKEVPEPTIRRMPWYLAYISLLRKAGVDYVSSTSMAKEICVDASQIAKDLSALGIKGKTRIGYEVAALEKALNDFLGFSHSHKAVMVGVGSLGAALMSDCGLQRYGLDIVAGFDTDPDKVGRQIGSAPVFDMSRLEEMCAAYEAGIGIIAVPVEVAQEVADLLVAAGVKALWNFTPVRIRTASDIVISNTSIYAHLAVMYNRLNTISTDESDSI